MLIYIIVHDFIKIVGKINCIGVLLKKSKSTRILDISILLKSENASSSRKCG